MSRKYAKPDADKRFDLRAWMEASVQQDEDFDTIASDPDVMTSVRARVKASLGRTADVPFKCGNHLTGYFVALTCDNDRISIVYLAAPGVGGSPDGVTLKGHEHRRSLRLACPVCGVTTSHNAVWVFRATISALRGASTTRPVIQVRT